MLDPGGQSQLSLEPFDRGAGWFDSHSPSWCRDHECRILEWLSGCHFRSAGRRHLPEVAMQPSPSPHRHLPRRLGRLAAWALALGVGLSLAVAGVAFAYWVMTTTSGPNSAVATAQSLPAGSTPAASVTPT